jgi:hypothetical protein
MPEYSIEEYANMYFVYGEYSGKATAAVESMVMLVLGQTEDILNIYYNFFNTNTNK